ncbi:hypothetical protein J3R30DRAFT_3707274 [Lentinula aciculospora]|uniref:Uncharacterized protein n=1 Tax=Lentinula aciculospora TaxID=153920 RepID=A0A9W9DK70_9AGAR|nr:hypothetical protein J3R30DRAFT_3707274 [Lentinula aciculospora]
MNDDQDNLHRLHSTTPLPLHLQPSVLVAVATLVLAGSAVFWKSNLRLGNLRLLSKGLENERQSATEDEHEPHDASEGNNYTDASKSQASRSKERRKRRKDPIKEFMKGGKKGKDLAKLLKHVDLPGPSDPSSSSVPNSALHSGSVPAAEQEPSSNTLRLMRHRSVSRSESGTRDPSVSFSSRSVSISSTAGGSARSGPSGDDGEEQDQEEEIPLTAMPPSPALPAEMNISHSPSTSYGSTPSLALSMFSMESINTADTSVQSAKYLDLDSALDEESISSSAAPLPKSTSKNIRRNKNSTIKNSTYDNLAASQLNITNGTDVPPAMLTSSESMPPTQLKDTTGFSSTFSTLNVNLVHSSSPSSSRAGKPPRFRSQTRQEAGTGQGTSLEFSNSMPIYTTFHASSSASKLDPINTDGKHNENEDHSASCTAFSFPTLNGTSGSGTGSTNDSDPSSSKASSNAGVGTPPPGSTNSTSLHTQTQIASLRGALEASRKREEEARGREEKTRSEMEKIGNELKVLHWEGNAWRRREGELQAQVHHLVHQMQSYAVYFAPPQQFSPQLQNLARPQRVSKSSKGKRPHAQNPMSPSSSRSTSKSSRPSHSSHASPITSLTQLPEGQATSQESSSPSLGSPIVPPSRMFSPSSTFSPGPSSTPFFANPGLGPFSPSTSYGMFSPTGLPHGGIPFASPHLGSASMMSPLSPQSPYLPYPSYTAFGGFTQGQSQVNGNSNTSNGGKMHPAQFSNMLNNNELGIHANTGSGTEPGGTMSTSSTMSSFNSMTTDSTDWMSPDLTTSPSPVPTISRGRGRKRGRGVVANTGNDDRIVGGYGPEFQYGFSYGYPYPYAVSTYQAYTGPASVRGENGKEGEGFSENKNSYDSDSEHDADGEVNELLAGSILKRPESMMGLRRSDSGGSSKSKIAKEKLKISQMKGAGLASEVRDGQQVADDGLSMGSPSSDSGAGSALGLNWIRDPGLFRRESSEAILAQRSPPAVEITAMSMPSSPPQSKLPFTSNSTPNEIDLDADMYSSSSSSSNKSTSEATSVSTESSESLEGTPPIEFTFPTIATWGYSYRTHSAGDLGDNTLHASADGESPEESVLDKDTTLVHDAEVEEEITPPADKMNSLGAETDYIPSDDMVTITSNLDHGYDDHSGTALEDKIST